MSLTFNCEHHAWQQRVAQELGKKREFAKTHQQFFSPRKAPKTPFPNVSPHESNYKSLRFSLAYAFGGTAPIRTALKPTGRAKSSERVSRLEKQIATEQFRRVQAESRLGIR